MKNSAFSSTVSITSLGCPKNLVDTEIMMGLLVKNGFTIVAPDTPADIILINTCAFIDDAKKESLEAIFLATQRKKLHPNTFLVVTGCLPQRYKAVLTKQLPEIDLFVGTGEFVRLPELIKCQRKNNAKKIFVKQVPFLQNCHTPRLQTTPFHSKYLKISEGCSHACAFCIIPKIRGPLASRAPEDICQEIVDGTQNRIREFNLVAQDLNEYGRDLNPRSSLYNLLLRTKDIPGDFWMRLLYLYPLQFSDKLVALIAEHPHVLNYVDIPLQHISEHMLRLMKRGSSSRYIHRLIAQLKKKMPDIVLRTTFLVGHPGETERDFAELKNFIRDTEFDRVGVFTYSAEEDTASEKIKPVVAAPVSRERADEIMRLQKKISLKKNQQLIGKTLKVLFEGTLTESDLLYQGRWAGQAPDIDGVVLIRKGLAKRGSFCNVKIVKAFDYDLLGEVV